MNDLDHLRVQCSEHVAHVQMRRAEPNHLDTDFLRRLADTLQALDGDAACRAVVLSSAGKSFSAGGRFGSAPTEAPADPSAFYQQAMRLFRLRKPMVAAVLGAAVGAGLGLALVADFRVAGRSARFSANFNRLGVHPGFGLSLTLPRLVGAQNAARLFYTGQRVDGAEALRLGLADQLVDDEDVLPAALEWARDLAVSAPQALMSTRETLRLGLADSIEAINRRECEIQKPQMASADFREGVAAMAERRPPCFKG